MMARANFGSFGQCQDAVHFLYPTWDAGEYWSALISDALFNKKLVIVNHTVVDIFFVEMHEYKVQPT